MAAELQTRTISTPPDGPSEYVIVAPDGKMHKVSKQLFEAIDVMKKQNAGTIEVQFKNGGIAGVQLVYQMK